jgi:GTP-binding protein
MFVDAAVITLSAGKGGNGVVAWRREKFIPKGGPSGGNGGKGGSVRLQADVSVLSLEAFRHRTHIQAEDGQAGAASLKQGRSGKDTLLKVPCGTLVKDADTGELLCDFTEHKQEWVACVGGRGGKGNHHFKSPTHQAPNVCTEGTFGERRRIELELKLIADIGLIGMPNAGKSTLLSALTPLQVKIGAYPFTTLFPNLSYMQFEDYSRLLLADIPGIIEGAHENRGLGLSFLKHIERTSKLLYVIDVSGIEGRDPFDDFCVLQEELAAYRADLLEKPFLVALNKNDAEGADERIHLFRERYPHNPASLFEISALERTGLALLKEALRATQ